MRRFRNRPLETSGLLVLSALLTAIVCFAPLYDGAMRQEATDRQLAQAPSFVTDVRFTSTADSDYYEPRPALPPDDLEQLVPDSIRPYYRDPVAGHVADASVPSGRHKSSGRVLSRPGQCEIVTIVEGSCPSRPGEVLVSAADRENFGFRVGEAFEVSAQDGAKVRPNGLVDPVPRVLELEVVGTYDSSPFREPSQVWAGQRLGGLSGTVNPGPPTGLFHDAWLAEASSFTAGERLPLAGLASYVGLELDQDSVGAGEVALVAKVLERLGPEVAMRTDADIAVESTIGTIAENVEVQVDQARVTVPLLMAQLALLCLVVLWLALRAAAEARRPELALARLRGRRRTGARRHVVSELLPVLLAGVLPGAVIAVAGCALLQRWLLSGVWTLPEVGLRLWAALALAAMLLTVAVLLVAHRMSLEPVADLLRRVPARRSPWQVGVVAAGAVAAAGAALVAIVSGDARGPVALAVPALLAVVVGVVLAYLSSPAVSLLGRWLLRRGRLVESVAMLGAARSGTAARTVAMVTVAAGLAVFSVNALSVGERNWSLAAAQRAGASVVVPASGGTVAQLRAAAREADPSGDHVTPVVRITPPGTNAPEVLAVLPGSFGRVALIPGGSPPDDVWATLEPGDAEPLQVTGERAQVRLEVDELRTRDADGASPPVDLWVMLRNETGPTSVWLARDLRARTTTRPSVALPCSAGRVVTGFALRTVPGSSMQAQVTLGDLRVDGAPVGLDPRGGWHQSTGTDLSVTSTMVGDDLGIEVESSGAAAAELVSAWLPSSVPVLATAWVAKDAGSSGAGITAVTGLDGLLVPADVTGTIAHAPASGDRTVVAALETLERVAPGRPEAAMELWVDSRSRRAVAEEALVAQGLVAGEARSAAALEEELRSTTAAWSLQLALVVGILGVLLAGTALLVVGVAGWRSSSRDLAGLRLAGLSVRAVRRVAILAQLPAVLVGVLAGIVSGLLGARIALPIVPLFATEPEVSLLELGPAWWTAVAAAGCCLVALMGTGAAAGLGLARRSEPQRTREAL